MARRKINLPQSEDETMTAKRFDRWLAAATHGDRIKYHEGFVADDRENPAVDRIAAMAFDAAERGIVRLCHGGSIHSRSSIMPRGYDRNIIREYEEPARPSHSDAVPYLTRPIKADRCVWPNLESWVKARVLVHAVDDASVRN